MLLPASQKPSSSKTRMMTWSLVGIQPGSHPLKPESGRSWSERRVQLKVQEARGAQQAEEHQRHPVPGSRQLSLYDCRGACCHQRPGLEKYGEADGGPQRKPVQPGHPARRFAGTAHPALLPHGEQDEHGAEGQLDGQARGRRSGLRFGRLVPGRQEDGGDHHNQAGQPAEDERQPLPGALLGAQDQDEGRERKRLEGDREPDEQQVKYHAAAASAPACARVGLTSQVGLGGDPSRCDGGDE